MKNAISTLYFLRMLHLSGTALVQVSGQNYSNDPPRRITAVLR